jgi:putative DNA primase/helicase
MTGGDPFAARFMRAEFFEFMPAFKLWFVANDDPRVRSTDEALWRRIRVIPFDVVIPAHEVDPDLPAKLRAEWPGILAWAVRGCLAWQRDGLNVPDSVLAATSSYRKRADHLRRCLRESIIQEEHAETASSLVYNVYTDWCAANHERPLSMAQFKRQLEDLGYEHARVKSGSVWRHIRLRR